MKRTGLVLGLVASGLLTAAPRTAGAPVFTRIVQSGDAMPPGAGGVGGVFSTFSAPATDGAAVSFHAIGSGREGIFTTAGGPLAVVAERTTLLPGTQVNFAFFGGPILENGLTLLSGLGAGGVTGVYLGDPQGLTIVADVFTPVPDGFGTFSDFGGFDLQGMQVVLQGRDALGRPAIYRRLPDGRLGIVADGMTGVPGGGTFEFLDLPVAGGKSAALRGGGLSSSGLYSAGRAGLARIADTSTAIPGAPSGPGAPGGKLPFGFFEQAATGYGQFVFVGGDAGFSHFGIYSFAGGKLGVVVDILTPAPGGGVFSGFHGPGAGRGAIVFTGFGSLGQAGLYAADAGGITPLVLAGDTLNGKTVAGVEFEADGVEGSVVAFSATFTDGSAGIYTTRLPG